MISQGGFVLSNAITVICQKKKFKSLLTTEYMFQRCELKKCYQGVSILFLKVVWSSAKCYPLALSHSTEKRPQTLTTTVPYVKYGFCGNKFLKKKMIPLFW